MKRNDNDNRIPSVIRDYMGSQSEKNTLDFLAFKDWLSSKENEAQDWITVARLQKNEEFGTYEDFGTYSVLVSASQGNLKTLMSSHEWDILIAGGLSNFGHPEIFQNQNGNIDYNSGLQCKIDGIDFQPFIFYRSFHGYKPHSDHFELSQTFILFYKAFFVPDLGEYQRIDTSGEILKVARLIQEDEDNLLVQVDSFHLRNYLAAIGCYLVRYHDHKRFAPEDITEIIKTDSLRVPIKGNMYSFELWIGKYVMLKEYKSLSKLLGKDIVIPYPKPHFEQERKYVEYIIGINEDGTEVKATCNADELSNMFIDRGPAHFLTPVFFDSKVLARYYDEPRRFGTSDAGVACLNLWSIEIDKNDEGLVVAYLGDLGRIPYREQMHWLQFNVTPRGKMSENRIQRDFFNKVSERENDVVYSFRRELELIRKMSTEKLGVPLLKELDERDEYLFQSLHLPLVEEWREFDNQAIALGKMTTEALNVKLLKQMTGESIGPDNDNKGSIDLFDKFLKQEGASDDDRTAIIKGFRMIHKLRAAGPAHRKGDELDKHLERYQLTNLSQYDRVKRILSELIIALRLITNFLRTIEREEI